MPSFHGSRVLRQLSSSNEEDEREVLIKLSISSAVIRSREEALEWLPSGVCVHVGTCVEQGKQLHTHLVRFSELPGLQCE